nr:MAG TPA: hypothetical protein [Caudoviricetes sp.]
MSRFKHLTYFLYFFGVYFSLLMIFNRFRAISNSSRNSSAASGLSSSPL